MTACRERTMTTWDGARLCYRVWTPPRPSKNAMVLLHRGHEHSGRWTDFIRDLALDDVRIFAWDARGHGRSDGERGGAPDFSAMVKDLDAFVAHLGREHAVQTEDLIVLGHSVAAVTAATWVHDYAPQIRGLILATPAFRIKLYVPAAISALRLRQALVRRGNVRSYVDPRMLTHDRAEAERYRVDPLIFRQIAVNVLIDVHDTSARIVADAAAIQVPTLILAAGADWVVDNSPTRVFFERLSSPIKTLHVYDELRHAIFHERDRERPIGDVRAFISDRFADAMIRRSSLAGDPPRHTVAEHERLSASGGRHYVPVRWALRTVGRLSTGIRLGWQTGFDSGTTLDYVYENRARGFTAIGRLIDRVYLNSIGWRGIRQRRTHLELLLRQTIARLHAQGRRVHIVDIASGPGRYVIEAVRSASCPVTVLLRDAARLNLDAARKLAATMDVSGIEFEVGDAFHRESLAALQPRPTIAVASGLYELFPDNDRVLESLRGVADALDPGGYLVYTNQPWHPQIEFIARVLDNRNGRPWVMRRRTQEEMDTLVRAVGFRRLSTYIDPWGIFAVSLAQRVER